MAKKKTTKSGCKKGHLKISTTTNKTGAAHISVKTTKRGS